MLTIKPMKKAQCDGVRKPTEAFSLSLAFQPMQLPAANEVWRSLNSPTQGITNRMEKFAGVQSTEPDH